MFYIFVRMMNKKEKKKVIVYLVAEPKWCAHLSSPQAWISVDTRRFRDLI
jgi:hypothetical protein